MILNHLRTKVKMFNFCGCFCLILYLIRQDIVDAELCDPISNSNVASRIRLKVYKGNSSYMTSVGAPLTNPGSIADAILPERDSILYVHGYMENTESDNVLVIIKAYLDKGDENLIVLDWQDVAIDINYVYVATQVPAVGKAVAESLEQLGNVINMNTLHVVGHSLGAHVAGNIARFMNVTLNRITGLDPAYPLFYPSKCHITATDAKIVVALHTDGGFYGTPVDTGTVDFYANRGISPQPGCPPIIGTEICSHQRSVSIYAESLANPKAFPAHKCFDNRDTNEVFFGDSTPDDLHGAYCFDTNSRAVKALNLY